MHKAYNISAQIQLKQTYSSNNTNFSSSSTRSLFLQMIFEYRHFTSQSPQIQEHKIKNATNMESQVQEHKTLSNFKSQEYKNPYYNFHQIQQKLEDLST